MPFHPLTTITKSTRISLDGYFMYNFSLGDEKVSVRHGYSMIPSELKRKGLSLLYRN